LTTAGPDVVGPTGEANVSNATLPETVAARRRAAAAADVAEYVRLLAAAAAGPLKPADQQRLDDLADRLGRGPDAHAADLAVAAFAVENDRGAVDQGPADKALDARRKELAVLEAEGRRLAEAQAKATAEWQARRDRARSAELDEEMRHDRAVDAAVRAREVRRLNPHLLSPPAGPEPVPHYRRACGADSSSAKAANAKYGVPVAPPID
jgi:hypothetical protein